jgi:ADP-ribosylglycohydrolase
MALSVVEELLTHGEIQPDALARRFTERFMQKPWRGYGRGASTLLAKYAQGADWREEAPGIFPGGSYGNGAAMRVAPIGAYFAGKPTLASAQAREAALITHFHPEGQAGAIAVAAGAALLSGPEPPRKERFLVEVLECIPEGETRRRVEAALALGSEAHEAAIHELGTGSRIAAFDTVPYCLWIIAHHSATYEEALWTTAAGGGDMDTTCAIVGGMLGACTSLPAKWLARREPLPADLTLEGTP